MQQRAAALLLRFALQSAPSKDPARRQALESVVSAAEATLPQSAILQPFRCANRTNMEGVYAQPSQALLVLQTLQDAFPRLLFTAALAGGAYWTELLQMDGFTIAPQVLEVARDTLNRSKHGSGDWFICQGFGEWDLMATAALTLTHSVRRHRSLRQRAAEDAFHETNSIVQAGHQLRLSDYHVRHLLRRGHVKETWHLETLVARYLDLALSRAPGQRRAQPRERMPDSQTIDED